MLQLGLMSFELLFDTGLLVLIVLVQLVIYPSFKRYSKASLKIWHATYTKRISLVVIPLMFGQLGLSILGVVKNASSLSIIKLILICIVWVLTFSIFVPLHDSIENSETTKMVTAKLVRYNWYRTLLWTIIFVISMLINFNL